MEREIKMILEQKQYDAHRILCELLSYINSEKKELNSKDILDVTLMEMGKEIAYLDVEMMILKLVNGR